MAVQLFLVCDISQKSRCAIKNGCVAVLSLLLRTDETNRQQSVILSNSLLSSIMNKSTTTSSNDRTQPTKERPIRESTMHTIDKKSYDDNLFLFAGNDNDQFIHLATTEASIQRCKLFRHKKMANNKEKGQIVNLHEFLFKSYIYKLNFVELNDNWYSVQMS